MTFSTVRMQFVGKQRVKASQFLLALGGEGWSHWSIVSHSGDHSCIVAHIPCVCVLSCFSHVWLLATPWTVACQVPLSVGFSEWEYWSGLPCPPPWDLPDPRIEPASLASPTLADWFFTTEPRGKHCVYKAFFPREIKPKQQQKTLRLCKAST